MIEFHSFARDIVSDPIPTTPFLKAIANAPEIGESKKGDLAGVRVYKHKHQLQLLLLAYSYDAQNDQIILMGHGTHENFYRDLKQL